VLADEKKGDREDAKARSAAQPAKDSVTHPVERGLRTMIQNIPLAMTIAFIAIWAIAGKIAIRNHSGH